MRQRVNIARALALEPLALIFISHHLSLVRSLCDDLLILRTGEVVEAAPTDRVFDSPVHECTRGLLAAIPLPDPDLQWLDRE